MIAKTIIKNRKDATHDLMLLLDIIYLLGGRLLS